MEHLISEKEKQLEHLEEKFATSKELPHDMKESQMKRIREKAKEIMRTVAAFRGSVCESYEKKALIILACQKLISAADQNNPLKKSTSTTIEPIKVYEAESLPPVEIERGGEEKKCDNDDNKTRKSKPGRKQPVHPSIFSLLEDEDTVM